MRVTATHQGITLISDKLVSVIIPSYNSERFVQYAIESLEKQTYPHLEIIIVDDGSTDQTISRLKALQHQHSFQLIEQANQGPGAARNTGMQQAKGDFICFLDADDRLLPGSIEKRLKCMMQNPTITLIFNDVIRLDKQDTPGYPFLAHHHFLQKFQKAISSQQDNLYFFNDQYFDCAMEHFPFIWTSSVMMRRDIIEKIGYFDESLRGSEDIDYWLRIAHAGHVAYIDEALTEWHHYHSIMTKLGNYDFYVDTIRCYQHFRRQLGEKKYLKVAINKRLAHYAFAGGYEALAVNALKPARKFFWQSLFFYPFSGKYWFYALVSLVPEILLTPLRNLKQKISL